MSASKKQFLKKGDKIVLLCVAIAVVLLLVSSFLLPKPKNGGVVEITVNGDLYGTYSLQEDRTLEIQGENGEQNTVVFENGRVYMQSASCPDHLCVEQGQIFRRGQSVVCLPNGLVITVKDAENTDVDLTI